MSPRSSIKLNGLPAVLGLMLALAASAPAQDQAEVSRLKTDLSADWTSLSVTMLVNISCTGPVNVGFVITKDAAGISLVPLREGMGRIKKGKTQSLTPQELVTLIESATSHYVKAMASLDPMEKAGPRPKDSALQTAWDQAYLAAGGTAGQDRAGIQISLKTATGSREYLNWFARPDGHGFSEWLGLHADGLSDP